MHTPNTQLPLVSVIVVNYKTPELVQNIVNVLSGPSIEMVIVDNSPSPVLEEYIAQYPQAKYIKSERNLGFAEGVNTGLTVAQGEWIYLLNTDTQTTLADILALVKIAKDHQAIVAVPQLVKNDGTIERNIGYFDGPPNHLINWIFARPRLADPSTFTKSTWVDLATGGALLVHKSVFEKIGTLDAKNFFMYFEDIDFSLRLKSHQVSILYVPMIKVRHRGGGSSDQDPAAKMRNYQASLHAYLTKHRGHIVNWLNTRLKIFN